MSALDRAVATYIRMLAAKRNTKQAHVADAIPMSRVTFERYWNGKRPMTVGVCESVFAVLGTTYAEASDDIRRLMGE